jgi:UBX domain-containing protein 1
MAGAAAAAAASNPEQKTANEDVARERFSVDSSRPSASINIRLLDGSQLKVHLNEDCTVANLREYICLARPEYASTTFALMTSYPTKELNDSQTLEEEKLANSTILIRRK